MNVELARSALELAKANPEKFNMFSWVSSGAWGMKTVKEAAEYVPPCGTTACYAGWVAFQAAPVGSVIQGSYVIEPGKPAQHIEQYAQDALDLNRSQVNCLFYLSGIEEVETAVNYLADNPDVDGDDLWEAAHVDPEDGGSDADFEDAWIYASGVTL